MYLPQFGSGIAAKLYDPGAPFFFGTIGYSLLAGSQTKRPSSNTEEGLSCLDNNKPNASYLFGLPGGLSPLNTSLFFSMKATY
jgi:hypothetical protein